MLKLSAHDRQRLSKAQATRRAADLGAARAADSKRQAKYRKKRRHEVNERRRARRSRDRAKKQIGATEQREQLAGLSIVTRDSLSKDLTRWRGPGWFRELALEKQADEILHTATTHGDREATVSK